MFSLRAASAFLALALYGSELSTCRSPGEASSEAAPTHAEVKDVTLKGVDASELTGREKADWSRYVSELLAPCADQPVSLAQCVNEGRACRQCVPAAKYLVTQVRRGRTRVQVEQAYRGRFAADQIKNIELADSPSKGPAGAPVLLVEFADFECPACGAARPVLDEIYHQYEGQVRFVFKEFPLGIHQYAEKAARAAVAAQKQGKFWEMHAVLFDNQQHLEPSNVELLAKNVGLDMARFVQDRDSEAVADVVARDRKQGEKLELASTPSIFINGRHFENAGEFKDDLSDWIALEVELNGGTPVAKPAPAASVAPPASAAPTASVAAGKPSATPKAKGSAP